MMRNSPWWNEDESKVQNAIRFIDNVMQDDEHAFLSTLARVEVNFELSREELGQVAGHFTTRWSNDQR